MQKVKEGDYVTITYEGTLKSGEIFDSATAESPFEFTVGQKCVFPSFETGMIGMKPGETRKIKVGFEESYGQRRAELVQTLERSSFGDKIDLQPGLILGMTLDKDGQKHQVPAMIMAIKGDQVTVDYNHPLSGQELHYKITLLAISKEEDSPDTAGCGCASKNCDCN
jgi:FKBP-type peptidyl-prolyl cis-trans isomerase 2